MQMNKKLAAIILAGQFLHGASASPLLKRNALDAGQPMETGGAQPKPVRVYPIRARNAKNAAPQAYGQYSVPSTTVTKYGKSRTTTLPVGYDGTVTVEVYCTSIPKEGEPGYKPDEPDYPAQPEYSSSSQSNYNPGYEPGYSSSSQNNYNPGHEDGVVTTTTTYITEEEGWTSTLLDGYGMTTTVVVGDPIEWVTTTNLIGPDEEPYTSTFGTGNTRTVEIGEPTGIYTTTTTFITESQGFTSTLQNEGLTTTVVAGIPIVYVTTTTYIDDEEPPYTSTLPGTGQTRTVEIGVPETWTTTTITSGSEGTTRTIATASGTQVGTVEIVVPTPEPTPDLSCDNQGMEYAVQTHDFYNSNAQYTNFDVQFFKTAAPTHGTPSTTNTIGFSNTNPDNLFTLYGGSTAFRTDYVVVHHRGYLYAPETGSFTFTIPTSDDITFLWVGQTAVSGWTRANAHRTQIYPGSTSVGATVTLQAGEYYPIRILYGNGQQVARFSFKVTGPNNEAIIDDNTSEASPYLVQYSCDLTSAPKYGPFGSES